LIGAAFARRVSVQQRFQKMARNVLNSRFPFARNFLLSEKSRLRSLQPRKALDVTTHTKKPTAHVSTFVFPTLYQTQKKQKC